jgi:hypothetical protein
MRVEAGVKDAAMRSGGFYSQRPLHEEKLVTDATGQAEDNISAPTSIEDLPLLLTPAQLAGLLGRSERTLERERSDGVGVPFVKFGNRIYYFREAVLESLRARTYTSTAEAKRAAKEAGR